jgi:hypothetical protein
MTSSIIIIQNEIYIIVETIIKIQSTLINFGTKWKPKFKEYEHKEGQTEALQLLEGKLLGKKKEKSKNLQENFQNLKGFI